MKEAGITTANKPGGLRSSENSIKAKATECEICGDDLDNSNSCVLECNHVYVPLFSNNYLFN